MGRARAFAVPKKRPEELPKGHARLDKKRKRLVFIAKELRAPFLSNCTGVHRCTPVQLQAPSKSRIISQPVFGRITRGFQVYIRSYFLPTSLNLESASLGNTVAENRSVSRDCRPLDSRERIWKERTGFEVSFTDWIFSRISFLKKVIGDIFFSRDIFFRNYCIACELKLCRRSCL